AVKDNSFYNNTIYMSPTPTGDPCAIKTFDVGTGNTVRNCIISTSGGVRLIDASVFVNGTVLFQGNNYWSGGSAFTIKWLPWSFSSPTSGESALAAWRLATSQEKIGSENTGSVMDPRLKNPGSGGTLGNPARLSELAAYKLTPTSPMINAG